MSFSPSLARPNASHYKRLKLRRLTFLNKIKFVENCEMFGHVALMPPPVLSTPALKKLLWISLRAASPLDHSSHCHEI